MRKTNNTLYALRRRKREKVRMGGGEKNIGHHIEMLRREGGGGVCGG